MTAFERIGGEEGVRALVDRFYDEMDALPDAALVRAMHPADLGESRRRLWMFLVGRLGGPALYEQERGHPRLRARHLPFAIGLVEAGQWMRCMTVALEATIEDRPMREELQQFFGQVAAHMVNRAEG